MKPRATAASIPGCIVAAYGRRFLVETEQGLVPCITQGRSLELACGDRVDIGLTSPGEGVIAAQPARSTLLLRSAAHRRKLIAANISQVAVMVAAVPSFSDELVARILVAAENAGLKSFLVLNKTDLKAEAAAALERLAPFVAAGYEPVPISALHDTGAISDRLRGEATVIVGQSGMGKSTLINTLVPGSDAATREISHFLDSGKHTTTHARMYRIDAGSTLIDVPGIQEFGLAHLDWREIASGFLEFRPYIGQCRYTDCRHLSEPGCAISSAAGIHPRRLELYRRIIGAESGR